MEARKLMQRLPISPPAIDFKNFFSPTGMRKNNHVALAAIGTIGRALALFCLAFHSQPFIVERIGGEPFPAITINRAIPLRKIPSNEGMAKIPQERLFTESDQSFTANRNPGKGFRIT